MRTVHVYIDKSDGGFVADTCTFGHSVFGENVDQVVGNYTEWARGHLPTKFVPTDYDEDKFRKALGRRRNSVVDSLTPVREDVVDVDGEEFSLRFYTFEEDTRDYLGELMEMPGYMIPGEEPLSQESARALLQAIQQELAKE